MVDTGMTMTSTCLVPVRVAIRACKLAQIPAAIHPAVVLEFAVHDLHQCLVLQLHALHLGLGKGVGILHARKRSTRYAADKQVINCITAAGQRSGRCGEANMRQVVLVVDDCLTCAWRLTFPAASAPDLVPPFSRGDGFLLSGAGWGGEVACETDAQTESHTGRCDNRSMVAGANAKGPILSSYNSFACKKKLILPSGCWQGAGWGPPPSSVRGQRRACSRGETQRGRYILRSTCIISSAYLEQHQAVCARTWPRSGASWQGLQHGWSGRGGTAFLSNAY